MKFPQDYPYSPPTVKFLCKMWHPNVYEVNFMQFVLISLFWWYSRQFLYLQAIMCTTLSPWNEYWGKQVEHLKKHKVTPEDNIPHDKEGVAVWCPLQTSHFLNQLMFKVLFPILYQSYINLYILPSSAQNQVLILFKFLIIWCVWQKNILLGTKLFEVFRYVI